MDKTIYKLKLETINEESIIFIPSAGKCGVIYTLHKDLIANCFKNTSSTAFAIQEIKKCFEEEWVNRWYFILYDVDFDDLIIKYYNLYIKPDLKEKINCKKEQDIEDTTNVNKLCSRIKELETAFMDLKHINTEYSRMLADSHKNNDILIDKLNETVAIGNLCNKFLELNSKQYVPPAEDKGLYYVISKKTNKGVKLSLIRSEDYVGGNIDDKYESPLRAWDYIEHKFSCKDNFYYKEDYNDNKDDKEIIFMGSPEEPFFTGQRIAYFIATLAGFSIIDIIIRAYIG